MSDDSSSSSSEDEFVVQLKLEEAEKKKKAEGQGKTRVDDDGTVMEYDAEKKAWFPKIDANFIAQYQMNYGTTADTSQTTSDTTSSSQDTWMPDTNSEHYAYWYYNIYSKNPNQDPSTAYQDYYNYYYQSYYQYHQQGGENTADKNDNKAEGTDKGDDKTDEKKEVDEKNKGEKMETSEESEEKKKADEAAEKAYQEYYEFYKDYYENHADAMETKKPMDVRQFVQPTETYEDIQARVKDYFRDEDEEEEEEDKAGGKGQAEEGAKEKKKRKANDASWFEMEDDHNTNVYVTSMPPDVTEEEFIERMNKYGLIVYDPRTRKPKVKLYKNADGTNKGDGLCCYIKSESVDLALQLLDGLDWRGYKVCVEKAKFEMKGAYDPKKKKKKLSNKQKRDMKERQDKLFDWRPDKMIGERPKWEKTLIIKNLFDLALFERDPTQIPKVKADVEKECKKYGDVRRVVIHDRHPACCASVSFASPAEADNCKEFLHNRVLKGRTLTAETWDGKTKYTVEETEEQREARLKQWAEYLEDKEAKEGEASAADETKKKQDASVDKNIGDSSAAEANTKTDNASEATKDNVPVSDADIDTISDTNRDPASDTTDKGVAMDTDNTQTEAKDSDEKSDADNTAKSKAAEPAENS